MKHEDVSGPGSAAPRGSSAGRPGNLPATEHGPGRRTQRCPSGTDHHTRSRLSAGGREAGLEKPANRAKSAFEVKERQAQTQTENGKKEKPAKKERPAGPSHPRQLRHSSEPEYPGKAPRAPYHRVIAI